MNCLRAIWSGMTWRRVLLAQALGQTAAFLVTFEWGYFGEAIRHTSIHFVSMGVYVFLLVPLALGADEAIRLGAPPRYVYPAVLLINPLIACAVAGAALWVYCVLWSLPWPAQRWGFTEAGLHMSVYCSLGLLVFMNRRTADRMLEGVRGAELRRVQLDQQLVESRLATAEAQIDPQMLFSALAQIKLGLEQGTPEAEEKLNQLIQTLRTALTRTIAVDKSGERQS
jgi:hypothetical protein